MGFKWDGVRLKPRRTVEVLLRNGRMTLRKCCAPSLVESRHLLKRREVCAWEESGEKMKLFILSLDSEADRQIATSPLAHVSLE